MTQKQKEEKTKEAIIAGLKVMIIWLFMTYIIVAYSILEFNPFSWSQEIRTVYAIGGIFLSFIFAGAVFGVNSPDSYYD